MAGACGPFKQWGLTAPAGFSVVQCEGDGDGGTGIALAGPGTPAAACAAMESWATSGGAVLAFKGPAGDTETLMLQKGSWQVSVACEWIDDGQTGITALATQTDGFPMPGSGM